MKLQDTSRDVQCPKDKENTNLLSEIFHFVIENIPFFGNLITVVSLHSESCLQLRNGVGRVSSMVYNAAKPYLLQLASQPTDFPI